MAIHTVVNLNQQKSAFIKRREHADVGRKQSAVSNAAEAKRISGSNQEIDKNNSNNIYSKKKKQSQQKIKYSHYRLMTEISEEEVEGSQQNVLQNLLDERDFNEEEQPKSQRNKAAAKKRLPTLEKGLGARALWEKLQKDSMKKLLEMDQKIPEDWKRSYGAYMRDSITQNRPIIYRSFTEHEDVQDMNRLLDKSYQKRVKNIRHHTNIMYKKSEQNRNKTSILLTNKQRCEHHDDSSLERYFANLELSRSPSREVAIRYDDDVTEELESSRKNQNLLFLTEMDSSALEGSKFRNKFRKDTDTKQVTDIPGFTNNQPSTSVPPSAPPFLSRHKRDVFPSMPHTTQGLKQPRSNNGSQDPKWQPLTIGALMDYSTKREVFGKGRFRFGSINYWRQHPPPTTTSV